MWRRYAITSATPGRGMTERAFDADLWRAQRGSDALDNPRVRQIVALERRHMRAQMPRAEVIALLGEPDRSRPGTHIYTLGASPVGVDFETYVIQYDPLARVADFGIRRS